MFPALDKPGYGPLQETSVLRRKCVCGLYLEIDLLGTKKHLDKQHLNAT